MQIDIVSLSPSQKYYKVTQQRIHLFIHIEHLSDTVPYTIKVLDYKIRFPFYI